MIETNKSRINAVMLYGRPIITVASVGNIVLEVEVDILHDHIEWAITRDGEIIYTTFNSINAIDKFCEITDGINADI